MADNDRVEPARSRVHFENLNPGDDIMETKNLIAHFENWWRIMKDAEERHDLVTLLAMEVDALRLSQHLDLLYSEVESPITRSALASLSSDAEDLATDIGRATRRVGRPAWMDCEQTRKSTPQATDCLDQACEALKDAETILIQDAIRKASEIVFQAKKSAPRL